MKKIKDLLRITFFLSIGIFFIWIFLSKLTPAQKTEILAAFSRIKVFWLIVIAFFGLLSIYLRAIRWNMLLEPMGHKPRTSNAFMAIMIGYLANLALPRIGEMIRCTLLYKYDNVPVTKSFGTVIVERVIDLVLLLVFFAIAILVQIDILSAFAYDKILVPLQKKFDIINVKMIIILILTVFIVSSFIIFLFIRNKHSNSPFLNKIRELLKGFWHGLKSVSKLKHPYLFVLYSILIWVSYFFSTYFAFFCLAETSNLGVNAALAVLAFGTVSFIVVQGGIGIYPFIVANTLALYGIFKTTGYAFGWIVWSLQTIEIIIGGLISFIILPIINKKGNNVETKENQ